MRPAAALAERLGLPFRDLDLLQQALIHSSYLYEHRDLAAGHNERLEFLGDAVVGLAIADALYGRYPDENEGVLSARRASIVSATGLARLANRLGLGTYLLLGEGEAQRGGRRRPALLASAFESVVGAVYLDLGYEAASGFVTATAATELASDRPIGALKSPKSRLQEYTQRLSGERPQYRLIEAVGPDHDKLFRIEVAIGGRVIGVGEGHSRRVAETAAAAHAIEALRAASGATADGSLNASELAEFLGTDVDDNPEDWDGPETVPDAGGEPWTEFDLETLNLAPEARVLDGEAAPDNPLSSDRRPADEGEWP
jgi:ribonuclease-3